MNVSAILVVVLSAAPGLMIEQGSQSSKPFSEPPADWKVIKEVEVPANRLSGFSQKLGAPVESLFNTTFEHAGRQIQINTITSSDGDSAQKIRNALLAGKSNRRWVVQNGRQVFEFVVRDQAQALLACKARYVLPIQPSTAGYRVAFTAFPVSAENTTKVANSRNELFNLFLQLHAQPESAELLTKIRQAVSEFHQSDELLLTSDLQKSVTATWAMNPVGVTQSDLGGQLQRLTSPGRKSPVGVSVIDVTGEIRIDSNVRRPSEAATQLSSNLVASSHFPADDPELRTLAQKITAGADSDKEKLDRILAWFTSTDNIRYDGLTGSRYGTRQVCQQRFGRCWDYSDLMITLCRASNLPARQVYGWMHESEGHVWCDVAVNGEWIMVDPTTGTICGSDYLPFSISESGEMPWIYASPVTITLLQGN